MSEELQYAITIAKEAGELALQYYHKEHTVRQKKDNTPVTEADMAVDAFIRKRLEEKFSYPVLSEEAKDDLGRLEADVIWCVDPIDGTRHFMKKDDFFAVHIGLVKNEHAILGVVYRPVTKELYYAEIGKGAFVSEEDGAPRPLRVSAETDITKMKAVITNKKGDQGPWARDMALQVGVTDFVYAGGVGISACMIARGDSVFYGYGDCRASEWDTCAPQVILYEAGGRFTDGCGNDFLYNQKETRRIKGFLATNGIVHDEALRVVSKMLC